jgi:ABC-2 type transport system ATP-binding protein
MTDAITVENLGIEFSLNRMQNSRLKDKLLRKHHEVQEGSFWALRDVSFTIRSGEAVGIIGRNGSGKSTLLKIIAGVLRPDEGTLVVNGDIAPLLELGSGFSKDLSGRSNVYLNGAIHGMNRATIGARMDGIIEFSELGKFIDSPLRHYSSGMKARLGFAIVTQLDSPILLMDEVLAVGDRAFKRKCHAAIEEMGTGGRTMLLVSHSAQDVSRYTARTLYIKEGKLVADGPTEDVVAQYEADTD